ncbi:hypothetical protein EXIGLDRAFT_723259, partial [Exidia glandulosa HHB12029]
ISIQSSYRTWSFFSASILMFLSSQPPHPSDSISPLQPVIGPRHVHVVTLTLPPGHSIWHCAETDARTETRTTRTGATEKRIGLIWG